MAHPLIPPADARCPSCGYPGSDDSDAIGCFWCETHPYVLPSHARKRPLVVCLCGSTRFWRTFRSQSLYLTLAGWIVLSIGAASGTDDEHFGNLSRDDYTRVKTRLDDLHLHKIDMADVVLALNVGGYIGESTRREMTYAALNGIPVLFLEPDRVALTIDAIGVGASP